MLFGIRTVLTADQWKKLRSMAQQGPPRGDRSNGQRKWGSRPGGPGGQSGPDGGAPPAPAQPNE